MTRGASVRRGGVILRGLWTCQECIAMGTHNEDDQCRTPGCQCSQCDYRGCMFDGEGPPLSARSRRGTKP